MELKVIEFEDREPEVKIFPSKKTGSLLINAKIGKLSFRAAVREITLPDISTGYYKGDIPALRNNNSWLIRQYVAPVENKPGNYELKRRGEADIIDLGSDLPRTVEVRGFQEVVPFSSD